MYLSKSLVIYSFGDLIQSSAAWLVKKLSRNEPGTNLQNISEKSLPCGHERTLNLVYGIKIFSLFISYLLCDLSSLLRYDVLLLSLTLPSMLHSVTYSHCIQHHGT